jgi:hypothetical protein
VLTGGTRPPLSIVPGGAEPDPVARLQQFRAAHPEVIISPGEFGTIQALIPAPDGETVITRYTLAELLDKLAELTRPEGERP